MCVCIYIYIYLSHFAIHLELTQHCKSNIFYFLRKRAKPPKSKIAMFLMQDTKQKNSDH